MDLSEKEAKHWQIRNLLARYAEKELATGDAASMYPEIAQHLDHCQSCREVVEDLLAFSQDQHYEPGSLKAADLPFVKNPTDFLPSVRPASTPDDFGLQLIVPFQALDSQGSTAPTRFKDSLDFIQPGGRMLWVGTFDIEGKKIQVLLTLHNGAKENQYRVVAEVTGAIPPAGITGQLYVGDQVYFSGLTQGSLAFDDVDFNQDIERFSLTLETPD